jgi:hypothetical protein
MFYRFWYFYPGLYIRRRSLKVAPVFEKMRSNGLAGYGHVMRRDESQKKKRDDYECRWAH